MFNEFGVCAVIKIRLFVTSLLAAAVAAPAAAILPIAVVNASFEAFRAVSQNGCGTGCSFTIGPIPGWVNSGNSGQFTPGPSAGNFNFFNSVPDGVTVAYSNGGPISQTLVATAIAGRTYTLTTQFGVRNDLGNPGSILLSVGSGSVFATGVAPSSGNWSPFTASYTATAADAGGAITITLNSPGGQGSFDAVSLATNVPEPATWALLVIGFGMVGFAARRRQSAVLA